MKARFFSGGGILLKAYGICRNAGFSMMMKSLRDKKRIKEQTALLEKRYEALQENYKELLTAPMTICPILCPQSNRIRLVSGPTGIYGKRSRTYFTR